MSSTEAAERPGGREIVGGRVTAGELLAIVSGENGDIGTSGHAVRRFAFIGAEPGGGGRKLSQNRRGDRMPSPLSVRTGLGLLWWEPFFP